MIICGFPGTGKSMMVVWFVNDNSPRTSPYRRGFEDGYRKAMKDYEQKGVTE